MMMRYRSLRGALRIFQHSAYGSSAAINPMATSGTANASTDNISKDTPEKVDEGKNARSKNLVSAAFNSLQEFTETQIEERMESVKTPEDLLLISELKGLTRKNALKIISKLADWTTEKKITINHYEGDPRFIKLCQMFGHPLNTTKKSIAKSVGSVPTQGDVPFNDLGVVLGVAGDDEAAKLISTITLPQMVKVLSSLAYKRRRSITLLRALAFNIGKCDEPVNIKQGADVLYACAQLSFMDEVMFEKICADLCTCIKENKKSAVIGSILTSLGMLRYKDKEILDILSDWVLKNFSLCRLQDVVSLIFTLGAVNHIPINEKALFTKLESHLDAADLATPNLWLDVVWALVILDRASPKHVASVLNPDFISRLAGAREDGISISSKLKLLNINGAAKLLIEGYNGPLLDPSSDIHEVEVLRNKDKVALISVVVDTLANLLPSPVYLNTNVNTGHGIIIDGECILDANKTPVPLFDKKTGMKIDRTDVKKEMKIAIVVLDYHDLTKGQTGPVGLSELCFRLIERSGYKILRIPHYEFNPHDKLVTRVQYIERQLKNVVEPC